MADVPADPADEMDPAERFIREYLPLGPVQDGDLSACTEAERRCYEIGYEHGQAFTLAQVANCPLWRRTVKQIMQRLWDNTVPFRHSLPMADACRHCGALPEPDGDHSCTCPHPDETCPDHPSAPGVRRG